MTELDKRDWTTKRRTSKAGKTKGGRVFNKNLRRKAQEAFTQGKEVEILLATEAAGEGINLQRARGRVFTPPPA